MSDDVSIRVPADPGYLQVMRAVTAAVASGFDMGIDEIDDLRLATTEAAEHLLAMYPDAEAIRLRLSAEHGRVAVLVTAEADDDAPLAPRAEGGTRPEGLFTWEVLSALVEDARTVQEDGAPGVAFAKRLLRAP